MITAEERERYHRQILLFGEEGQEALKAARVLIAGAGGLGTVIAVYLTAAGVGTLRVADCDFVEASNFNRQILHWSRDLGRPKTASVEEKLALQNPLVRIETLPARIEENTILNMADGCDLIVDAMDNFPTRYLLNRTALTLGIPLVHGAVRGSSARQRRCPRGKPPA